MRKIATIVSMLLTAINSIGQNSAAERDSMMREAEQWRAMGNNTAALNIYSRIGTERARLETADTHIEMGQIAMALREAQTMLKDKDFHSKDDALLIVARCRDIQGFTAAANRAYRRLEKNDHAEGLYYAAVREYASGHNLRAEELCKKAIGADRNLTPAHQLIGAVEVTLGHRYRAMLAIYYYLLTCSDAGREQGLRQLMTLWRFSAQSIDILRKGKEPDPLNDSMDKYIVGISTDSITKVSGRDAIMMLVDCTEKLLTHMSETTEDNLDFWQIEYADLLIELHKHGYTRPMCYHICSSTWPDDAKEYMQSEYGGPLFNEFRLWTETRLTSK